MHFMCSYEPQDLCFEKMNAWPGVRNETSLYFHFLMGI